MLKRSVFGRVFMIAFLLMNMLTFAFQIQPARANGTIYIWPDGSIEGTTQIVTSDYAKYVFTADITGFIVVSRSNIVIDGQGHTVEGLGGDLTEIALESLDNVTIKGLNINGHGNLTEWGITLVLSSNCSIYGNNVTNNHWGVYLFNSSGNNIYHNNFIGNVEQVHSANSTNIWDDGYPSGGNYWSDYVGVDVKRGANQDLPGSDGVGDLPYIIDPNNMDRYPLMNPYGISPTVSVGGYSVPMNTIKLEPITPYLMLVAILAMTFAAIRRKASTLRAESKERSG